MKAAPVVYPAPSRRRNPLPLIIAVVVGLVAVIGTYFLLRPDQSPTGQAQGHRTGCQRVDIAASSEKAALLGQLADAYDKGTRTTSGGCADIHVTSLASGAVLDALSSGAWDEKKMGAKAPQVWTPASSAWLALLRQRSADSDRPDPLPAEKPASVAQTPLVLAMPKPMAEALGWPDKPIGWADVLGLTSNAQGWGSVGHPEWGAFKLGKTNPRFSTSGLNATIGAYIAATGRSGDLTEADLSDARVLGFVKGVEAGVVHYGDTTLTFLSNLAEADARGQGMNYVSAVAVEEKSVYDYNQGNPTGDPALVGKGRKPQTPLVAVYPKEGTLLSDNPYAVLTTASEVQRAGAADFLAYLQEPAQQKRFVEAAFRGYQGERGAAINKDNGLLPDAKFTVLATPSAPVTAKAVATWEQQRKRARVLLVMDVSGSMANTVVGGRSKLELAKQAATNALGAFAPDDEVGLWTFSTERQGSGENPYTPQVPIGPTSANADRLRQVISSLSPNGGTALYATTRAAQKEMLATAQPDKINAVVVLTDGKNEYPRDDDLDGLVRDLDASKRESSVRVFTIAYGDEADLGTLQKIAKASQAAAYDATDPASIDKVLVNVISNF